MLNFYYYNIFLMHLSSASLRVVDPGLMWSPDYGDFMGTFSTYFSPIGA